MSNHAKEWGCVHTSLKRGGFKQLKIACSRPYCFRFSAYKSGARDDLVSSLNCDRRFRFFKTTSHTIALRTRESTIFFLNSPLKCAQNNMRTAVIQAQGLTNQKSTLKKLELALSCKSSGPCPQLSTRVPLAECRMQHHIRDLDCAASGKFESRLAD